MKKLLMLIFMGLTIFGLMAFASCGYEGKISAPRNLRVDPDTLTLKWTGSSLAKEYSIAITDSEGNVDENPSRKSSYELERLAPGDYTIKVKANEVINKYAESDWSDTIPFTKKEESGLAYRLINSKTEYELISLGSASSDVVVDDYFRGKPVTAIASKAFRRNSTLTSIVIGKNVKTIDENAFTSATNLTSVSFKEGCVLTSIGEKAFQSCSKLQSVSLPDSVVEIPANCFTYCSSLTDITLGKNIRSIGKDAFNGCRSLTEIVIPDSVVSIGETAFNSCASLETLTIGNGVETILDSAFSNCSSLTTITLGNKLNEIGVSVFNGCSELVTINIPESVSIIDQYAFANCSKLQTVTGMLGVEKIGAQAFYNTKMWFDASDFFYVGKWFLGIKEYPTNETNAGKEALALIESGEFIKNDTVGIGDYAMYAQSAWYSNADNNYLVIPSSVKYIGYAAFAYVQVMNQATQQPYPTYLTRIFIGSGTEKIDAYAFANLSAVRNISFYDTDPASPTTENCSLESIGMGAFTGCGYITSIDLPDTVKNIGRNAFQGTGLTNQGGAYYADNWLVHSDGATSNVVIKEGTVGIAEYAFYNHVQAIFGIEMPDSVIYINRAAFYKCSGLGFSTTQGSEGEINVKFNLSNNIEVIEDHTFYQCQTLGYFVDVILPENLTSIGRSAFYGTALTKLDIPDSVTFIGEYAFYNNYYLTEVQMGSGVTTISARAFGNCAALTSISLANVETIGLRAFYMNTSLKNVDFGDSLEVIEEYAFYQCAALTSVVFPDTLVSIDNYAFRDCTAIETISFGEGLKTIGDAAFLNCYAIKSLIFHDGMESIGKFAFRNCKRLEYVLIEGAVAYMDAHLFNGSNTATIFVIGDSIPEEWNTRWNSAYRPLVLGVTYSSDPDDQYIVSFVKSDTTLFNPAAANGVSEPIRKGYTFDGWATSENGEAVYSASEIINAPNGTTLYSVWS